MLRKVTRKIQYVYDNYKYGRLDRKKVFEDIYAKNIWARGISGGREKYEFYSGPGSHDERYVEPYCKLIRKFISENGITSICDIGCGDFNIASKWINESISYEGVDIVKKLIEHHNKNYSTDKIHFECLDIVEDDLPDAQLCLVKEVLQHLKNEEVNCFLNKIKKYKYVIITEHVTKKCYAKKYNIDIPHGNNTRVSRKSGLYFDEKPFNLKIEPLLEISDSGRRKNIAMVSVLIRN